MCVVVGPHLPSVPLLEGERLLITDDNEALRVRHAQVWWRASFCARHNLPPLQGEHRGGDGVATILARTPSPP